jgi:PiT family inorganic phosphate transporter
MLPFLLYVTTLFLAYANGANDNFKGVATLFGSNVTNYRTAIWWATGMTFLGSIASIFMAQKLISLFSNIGTSAASPSAPTELLVIIAASTTATVMIATIAGFPVSTTHALIGALTGAHLVWARGVVDLGFLWTRFFLPLLTSPIIAIIGSVLLYPLLHEIRKRLGISKELCLCVTAENLDPQPNTDGSLTILNRSAISLSVGTSAECEERYTGRIFGVTVHQILTLIHFISAGAVSFARGLNDTPKIAALLATMQMTNMPVNLSVLGVGIAIGGLLNARKVADTMSRKITTMNHGQGLTANLITSTMVILASIFGMPVSTTHVSVGSLFGIGVISRKANIRMISSIVGAWVITLPISLFVSGALTYILLK